MWHAEDDLELAKAASSDSTAHTNDRAFHSQQAAEKAIKAAIASTGAEPMHDLVTLSLDLPPEWNVGAPKSDLSDLSAYAMASRYADAAISKTDADKALYTAESVVNAMRSQIR